MAMVSTSGCQLVGVGRRRRRWHASLAAVSSDGSFIINCFIGVGVGVGIGIGIGIVIVVYAYATTTTHYCSGSGRGIARSGRRA